MGTSKTVERKLFLELAELLKKNEEKVLSGQFKVCLTTSSLAVVINKADDPSVTSSPQSQRSRSLSSFQQQKLEEKKKWLLEFVLKIKALKIIHGTCTIKAPVQIGQFNCLQVLEVKKVPIHMLEGLSRLRAKLREIRVTKSIQTLQELLEMCGGDRSSGMILWSHLKTAYLSFNNLSQLDDSLRCVPFVEVLDLSHNSLTTEGEYLKCLTEVIRCNLGFNMLTSFPAFSLANRSKLKTLVLRNNSLENLDGVEELTGLEELDVADNLLLTHSVLEVLCGLNMLQVLCLSGNPLSYHVSHRLKTATYLSSNPVGHGVFLLDGKQLAGEEIKAQRMRFYRKSLDDTDSGPASSTSGMRGNSSSASLKGLAGDTSNGSLLHPGGHHYSKKKRGHRRVHSKERVPNIVNFEDSLAEDHSSAGASPTGSLVDEADLSKAEDDKKRIESMREFYKDDWLKALTVDRNQAGTTDNQSASNAENQVLSSGQIEVQTEARVTSDEQEVVVEQTLVATCSTVNADVHAVPRTVEAAVVQGGLTHLPLDDSRLTLQQDMTEPGYESPVSPLSPDTPKPGKDHVDIYSINRGMSIDMPETPFRSPPHDAGQYGDESEPFIIMLPDCDMKQLFVTVNQRFITEKDFKGDRQASLDLKCLLNIRRTDEDCFGANIPEGVTLPILTLDFDYVQRDKRQRKYAMESEEFTSKFKSLISHHVTSRTVTEMLECLKCKEKFQQRVTGSSSKLQRCPNCDSKMVIKAGNSILQESSDQQAAERDNDLTDEGEPQLGDVQRRRSNAFLQPSKDTGSAEPDTRTSLRGFMGTEVTGTRLQDYVDSLLSAEPEDTASRRSAVYIPVQGADSEVKEVNRSASSESTSLHKENSWSDVRKSQSSARGSVSSVDSDITILATQSKGSIATISESSHESLTTTSVSKDGRSAFEVQKPETESSTGDIAVSLANQTQWVQDKKGQLTPVGSPLSNSVCSSMVSSVYENTLSGGGDDNSSLAADDGVLVISRDSSLTNSSTDSVSVRRSTDKPSSRSGNRNVSIINNDFYSMQSANIFSTFKEDQTEIQADSRLTDDSMYTTANFSQQNITPAQNSTNISITVDDNTASSIYDTIHSESSHLSRDFIQEASNKSCSDDNSVTNPDSTYHSSPLRRPGSTRRSRNNRSAMFVEEKSESGSEYSGQTDLSAFPDELSPIKRTSSTRAGRRGKTSAMALSFPDDSLKGLGTSSEIQDDSAVSRESAASTSVLPWEQEESSQREETRDRKHESLIHDEFVNIDHRLQLYLELHVFRADEVCQCFIKCPIVQYMNKDEMLCLLVISTSRILIFQSTGNLDSSNVADAVHCIEDQPITELVYVDIGYGYQTLRLEFGTECSSYSLLIADESRCKQFLTLLSDIIQTAALQDHSKLEGISKSNPVTQSNLDSLIREGVEEEGEEEEEQVLVKYLLITYTDDDAEADQTMKMSLVVTTSYILLVKENHQWPLPRLQAPLSDDIKGQQFTVVQRERINNIEGVEFNEYNPTELRLTFETLDSSTAKKHWMVAMETNKGVKSFVDAIREPWEKDFGVSLDVTSSSFSEVE